MFRNARPTLPVRRQAGTGPSRLVGSKRGSRFQPSLAQVALVILGASLFSVFISYRLLIGREEVQEDGWGDPDWAPSAAFCAKVSPPIVCAHGGDTTRAHPNTIKAIRAVPSTGAQCVEIDVSRTADDVLVASHGRDLARLLGKTSANVGDLASDTVFTLDAGNEDHIPSFEAAIESALESGIQLITVDTKPGPPRGEGSFAEDVHRVLKRTKCGSNCQFWAKSDSLVRESIIHNPTMQTGYVVMNQTEAARKEGMDQLERIEESAVVATYYGMVDERYVREAHNAHKEVHTWTVNDKEALRRVLDAGVDAIVTNHPRVIQQTVDSLVKKCQSQQLKITPDDRLKA